MASQSYLPRPSLPVTVPTKSPHYPPPAHGIVSRMSSSPPEAAESVGSSSGPSFGPSTTYSGYAASASDNESSSGSTNSIDLLEYMSDRLTAVMDPLPLDRSILTQAQT